MAEIRVELPLHLRRLSGVAGYEVTLKVEEPVTLERTLDALEARFSMLEGTVRDHVTHQRRPFLRFFACGEDLSNEPMSIPLPAEVVEGREPLIVLGAIAGG